MRQVRQSETEWDGIICVLYSYMVWKEEYLQKRDVVKVDIVYRFCLVLEDLESYHNMSEV